MSYKLFLDSTLEPKDITTPDIPRGHWFIARTYTEFRRLVENRGIPGYVSFGSNLAKDEFLSPSESKTGLDCARWLCDHCRTFGLGIPECFVHSSDSKESVHIDNFLKSFRQAHIK